MKRWRSVVLVAGLVLGVAACGGDDDGVVGTGKDEKPSTASGSDAAHNDADVTFAQMMIPHHEGALEMAELALDKAESPEVKDLAKRIKAAQGPEIETMQGWLKAWGEDVKADSGGMDHGGGMSSEQMDELETVQGAEFDRAFLTMMKEHHEGAIEMAEKELEDGQFQPAKDLAQDIIEAQQAEIEEIDRLLA